LGKETIKFWVIIMVTICGRNSDELFHLTRDGDVEATYLGFPNARKNVGSLYHYAWQYTCSESKEEFDEFGRNYTDRLFIRFCASAFENVDWDKGENSKFKYLSCKKVGDDYIARLELTDETLEMELGAMVELLERRFMEGGSENNVIREQAS
jgi:hypothetical protein